MTGRQDELATPAVLLVRELIAAIGDGRSDDVIARVHPDVVWRPVARPGLSQYRGHEGMVRFLGDIVAAYGPYRVEVDEAVEVEKDVVVVVARPIQVTEDGERLLPKMTSTFTLIGGQVIRMDANPAPIGP